MSKKRTGINTLAYMGVEATTPPQLEVHDRAPTPNDYTEFNVGTIWIYNIVPQQIWMLVSKAAYVSTWVQLGGGGGVGTITEVDGTDNINTVNPLGPIVTVRLNKSIFQPVTNSTGDEGLYALGGLDFLHNYGTHNTFLGSSAGNRTLTVLSATENTGTGYQVLASLVDGDANNAFGDSALGNCTSGSFNCAFGSDGLVNLVTGDNNLAFGSDSLGQLVHGSKNIGIGESSGFNYTDWESSNIVIGNLGTLGESNTMRIGTDGIGIGQQNSTYIAGIYNRVVGNPNGVVKIDSTGMLGSSNGGVGQVLIGGGNGPVWANLTSSDGTVIIANGINTIDLKTVGGGGGAGATTFITNTNSPAVIDVATISILGTGPITTDGGSGSHVVTVSMTNGTNGQILIAGGAEPIWADLVSGGGSVVITYPAPNTINLEASGAAGGAVTFITDVGNANVAAGLITVAGGLNINTSGAGSTVTVNLNKSIVLPVTNIAGTEGMISLGASSFMHNYGSFNTFVGNTSGNRTLTVLSATDNSGFGFNTLTLLQTGAANSCFGSGAGRDISFANYNCAFGELSLANCNIGNANTSYGFQSLSGITSGTANLALGAGAGSALTVNDSSNILLANTGTHGLNNTIIIGTQGAGIGEQNTAYFAGIWGSTVGAPNTMVSIDNTGKLGTINGATNGQVLIGNTGGAPSWSVLTPGTNITIDNSVPGHITINATGGGGTGDVTEVQAGENINVTNPTGPIPIVNLNKFIQWTETNGASTYGIDVDPWGGAVSYKRFLRSVYNRSLFLGVEAGTGSAVAEGNTGIGYQSLNVISASATYNTAVGEYTGLVSTTASQNTLVGANAGRAITTGGGNVLIGYSAGWDSVAVTRRVTTQGNNVCVGNQAQVSNTAIASISIGEYAYCSTQLGVAIGQLATAGNGDISIGYSAGSAGSLGNNISINSGALAVGLSNTTNIGNNTTSTTYVKGIWNKDLGASAAQSVYVTSTGLLGTTNIGNSAFLAIQSGTASNVTGDGTMYWLGTVVTVPKIYDTGGNFYIGNGAGAKASFTAPVNGLYFLEVQVLIGDLVVPPVIPTNCPIEIWTSNRVYDLVNSIYQVQVNGRQSYFYNVIADMDAADYANFGVSIVFGSGTKTLDVLPTQTFVMGYLVRPY